MDGKKGWIGNKVYLVTKSNREYSGIIINLEKNSLVMEDKFGKKVYLSFDDIRLIQEENKEGKVAYRG